MQVIVTGKQFDVGDSLRNHAADTTATIVERYFGKATEAHVVFCHEGNHVRAEISVHASRGLSVQGGGEAVDAYIAFDSAAEHIDKRLRRHKRRLKNRHGRGKEDGAAAPAPEDATAYVLAGPDAEGPSESEDEIEDASEGEPLVIAELRTRILRLSVSEAVMRLDLADLPALLFRNSARGNLNLIYRRGDGNIGWIDPDLAERRSTENTKAR